MIFGNARLTERIISKLPALIDFEKWNYFPIMTKTSRYSDIPRKILRSFYFIKTNRSRDI